MLAVDGICIHHGRFRNSAAGTIVGSGGLHLDANQEPHCVLGLADLINQRVSRATIAGRLFSNNMNKTTEK